MHLLQAVAQVFEEAAGVLGRDGPERPVRGLEERYRHGPVCFRERSLTNCYTFAATERVYGSERGDVSVGSQTWPPSKAMRKLRY